MPASDVQESEPFRSVKGTEQLDTSERYRAPALVIFGALCAVLGFVVITVIGIIEFNTMYENRSLRIPYPSKNGYWPSTVSEMVHNHDSPGGKVFYTLGLIAGACLFVSFYPYQLRNVYTGKETVPGTTIYWTTFRQLVPPMGLWLLIGVNTFPATVAINSRGYVKMFCVFLHLMGAGMMFMGYMCCEFKCLGMMGFKLEKGLSKNIEPTEMKVRKALAMVCGIGMALFSMMQVLLILGKKSFCCGDQWVVKGDKVKDFLNENVTIHGPPQLIDTASGELLVMKMLSFLFEDIAGIALVLSHIAVWYYCEERHVDYGKDTLAEVYPQSE